MQGFKEFILRGNLVELAVAFVIGAAFAGVVESFTAMLPWTSSAHWAAPPTSPHSIPEASASARS